MSDRPPLRLWKGEPVVILGDAKKAALKADWSLARWTEFSRTAWACLTPDAAPEEMALFLAVVRERFDVTEAPGFTLNTHKETT